ncbi:MULTISPECIES: SRPBCC family protein [Streptomycetaceae]|uniref:SRPBCC family protein n=1 Tax=Streptantibioticus cattleyicolor (strain ATCC 35852 / DSM 46488 / JCM 4925 / NBRC 14057 / NRRL 8057) TaxID=1003195 RepID=F8JVY4_STREN|nr:MULTISPECIES: SRPBCC family protein [Streptomycetaceae]AEW92624.1 hypothetical protein SCATT_02530 [Streptantibioticus cattleyicolor NRRL 8057 = DSM 46488]MYS57403.1 SRPBCC family protein [Streptomyces sp. SID5468]CCB72977.1 conserved protein of unknown function [Streptantibioticus cattleyicolor NRRL 8057 = DSM 46488]
MVTISRRRRYTVPAEQMWKRIGDFYALHTWVPGVADVVRVPEREARRIVLADGGELIETLVEAGECYYRYRMDEPGPIPVRNYRSALSVASDGDHACVVEWTSEFAPRGTTEAEAGEVISAFQVSGLDALTQG